MAVEGLGCGGAGADTIERALGATDGVLEQDGQMFYFCSRGCRAEFPGSLDDPR